MTAMFRLSWRSPAAAVTSRLVTSYPPHMAALAALDALLTQEVADIHRVASSVAAGGGPAWDALLRQHTVTPLDAAVRARIVAHMRLPHGAVPAEVSVLLQGLQRWAQAELERLLADPAGVTRDSVERLQERIAALAQRE